MSKIKPDSLDGPFPMADQIRQLSDAQRAKLDQDYQNHLEKMRAILRACLNWQFEKAVSQGLQSFRFTNYTFSSSRSAKTFFTRMDAAESPLISLADQAEAFAVWAPLDEELRARGFTVLMTIGHRGPETEAIFDVSW
jgi:hypothetical protein